MTPGARELGSAARPSRYICGLRGASWARMLETELFGLLKHIAHAAEAVSTDAEISFTTPRAHRCDCSLHPPDTHGSVLVTAAP